MNLSIVSVFTYLSPPDKLTIFSLIGRPKFPRISSSLFCTSPCLTSCSSANKNPSSQPRLCPSSSYITFYHSWSVARTLSFFLCPSFTVYFLTFSSEGTRRCRVNLAADNSSNNSCRSGSGLASLLDRGEGERPVGSPSTTISTKEKSSAPDRSP